MGEVICVYRIMPDDPKNLEAIKKELNKLKPARLEEQPIGFGVSALRFTAVINDGPGVLEELENKIDKIKGIGSWENTMTSRAL